MKYGIMLPSRGDLARPDNIIPIAKKADELGFAIMMFPDHIVLPNEVDSPYPYTQSGVFPVTDTNEATEQLTMLAFLAGQTESIRLVTSVMIVPHRPPVLTAKILSTIDVLSNGRLTVGVGVGWLRKEFEALQTPPFEERGTVTDEYIRIFKELWTSDSPSFEGKYHSFSDLSFLPKPVQKPHPPIWVGGRESPGPAPRRRAGRRLATNRDQQPVSFSCSRSDRCCHEKIGQVRRAGWQAPRLGGGNLQDARLQPRDQRRPARLPRPACLLRQRRADSVGHQAV